MSPVGSSAGSTHAVVAAVLLWGFAGPAVAQSAATTTSSRTLAVSGGVFDPLSRELAVTVRCNGARAECRGRLQIFDLEDRALSVERRVRLRPGRAYRLRFATIPGLKPRERLEPQREVRLSLVRTGRPRLRKRFDLPTRYTSRSGTTLALTPVVRTFTIESIGLYACARPAGLPISLGDVARRPGGDYVYFAAAAGRYVSFVSSFVGRCPDFTVIVFDVLGKQRHLTRGVSTRRESEAHGCQVSGEIGSLVLDEVGTAAWIETPGGDGNARVRVVSPLGDRVVESAPDIDAGSLTLADGTLRWLRDGQLRSAPLN